MAIGWYLLPSPVTLGEVYLQPTGKNQRSRARIRRGWLSAKPTVRDWAGILPEILSIIFSKLTSFAILWPAQAVCRSWRQASLEPHIWHRIDLRDSPEPLDDSVIKKLAKEMVDRSRGRVEELFCGCWGSDEVLTYIINKTIGLSFLSLSWQFGLTRSLMVEFLHRCPLLEDLHISYYNYPQVISYYDYSAEIFEDIVQWCPKLKCICLARQFWGKLNLNCQFNPDADFWCDSDAPNIPNNMTQLRELWLIKNMMTNKGLHVLLDKCPHLDLLDIRLCRNICLDSEIKVRLERIRIVRLPHYPISKYGTDVRYTLSFNCDWSVLDHAGYVCSDSDCMSDDYCVSDDYYRSYEEYDFSDSDYMSDDYYRPYEEYRDEYDFWIS